MIPIAILKPFFLKKFIKGPEIVDDSQAVILIKKLSIFNFLIIFLSNLL